MKSIRQPTTSFNQQFPKSWSQTVLKVDLTFRITQNHFAMVLCGISINGRVYGEYAPDEEDSCPLN